MLDNLCQLPFDYVFIVRSPPWTLKRIWDDSLSRSQQARPRRCFHCDVLSVLLPGDIIYHALELLASCLFTFLSIDSSSCFLCHSDFCLIRVVIFLIFIFHYSHHYHWHDDLSKFYLPPRFLSPSSGRFLSTYNVEKYNLIGVLIAAFFSSFLTL